MPVINIGLDRKLGEVTPATQGYVGDEPPAGAYVVKTSKTWLLKETKAGDWMLTIPLNVSEPKGSKKEKYNGFTIWHNLVLTEKSAPFVNAFLEALDIDPAKIWAGKMDVDGQKVSRISGVKSLGGIVLMVSTKKKTGDYSGLEITSSAPFEERAEEVHPDEEEEFEAPAKTADVDDDDSF